MKPIRSTQLFLALLTSVLLQIPAATAVAQADEFVVCNKWCSRKDSLLLFDGGNNVLLIWHPTLKPSDIRFKSLDRGLRVGKPEQAGDTTRLMAMPFPKLGKTMRLAILNKRTGKILKTVSFASDSIPVPKARLGNILTSEASRKDLLNQLRLRVSFPGSLYNYPYEIQEFSFFVQTTRGAATIPVKGFMLNKEVYQQIKDAPAGTIIRFESIKVSCPECDSRQVPDLRIKIKE